MDKRLVVIPLLALLIVMLQFPVKAHPGATDSQGGHYDHSTGEYHFHHGYPAHQHENGVCPYDFKDNTDHSNHGSNSSSKSNSYSGLTTEEKPVENHTYTKDEPTTVDYRKIQRQKEIKSFFKTISFPLIFWGSIIIIGIVHHFKNAKSEKEHQEYLREQEEQKKQRLAEEQQRLEREEKKRAEEQARLLEEQKRKEAENKKKQILLQKKNQYNELVLNYIRFYFDDRNGGIIKAETYDAYTLNRNILFSLSHDNPIESLVPNVPDDVYFENHQMRFRGADADRPYGRYTGYTVGDGKKVHLKPTCAKNVKPVFILNYPPSQYCASCFPLSKAPKNQWYIDYCFLKRLFDYYSNDPWIRYSKALDEDFE